MTLVSSFFADADPDSECRSFLPAPRRRHGIAPGIRPTEFGGGGGPIGDVYYPAGAEPCQLAGVARLLLARSGGVGVSVHNIRATGSCIRGTNGTSNGIVPMLRVFNDTACYVDQRGGKRKGAFAVYLEPWHSDIFEFLDLWKNHVKRTSMLRRYVHMLGSAYLGKETRRKKELEDASVSVDFSSIQKDLCVRIIAAGGLIELYQGAVTASRIMEKYPGMAVARPDIFKHPNELHVGPEEQLLPRQEFYLVPTTTVRKLRRKFQSKERDCGMTTVDLDSKQVAKKGREDTGEQFCSAREFYASREKWSDYFLRKCGKVGGGEKKGFTPPIKKARVWRRVGWQPSLDIVEEISP